MKIKKLLSALLVMLLAMLGTSLTTFATEINTSAEFEETYSLNQNNTDGYGYLDYEFIDKNGNTVDFKPETNTNSNTINALDSTESDLPARYNLRDPGLVTEVKDQGAAQSCWAFSSLGAMESNLLVQGKKASDFSEAHLVWFGQRSATTDTNSPVYGDGITRSDPYGTGGNWMFATAALSKWSGTVNESDYPFYPYETYKMGNYSENERHNTSGGAILNSAESLTSMSEIKEWIMDNGAVEANFHFDEKFLNMTDTTCSYYCNDASLIENHAILIVGWDDYYSKSNFRSDSKPTYPGAFLCKNSWSSDWGEDGYFWISYFDATIRSIMGYTCVDSETYDNNYTYNGLGYGGAFQSTSVNGAQVANVFTSKGYETLSAISTYTLQSDTYAEVFVYKNLPANYSKPNQGTLAYSSKKTLLSNAGYHTISINTPISLNPNEIFSVVIRLSNSDNLLYVVAEYEENTNIYSSKPRQSYVDTSGTNANWFDMTTVQYWDNVCIQAFTECNHQPHEVTVPATCETNGTITTYCSQCNEQLTIYETVASGHTFGEWKTTKASTKSSEGEKTKTCEICGCTEMQSIPRLPQTSGRRVTPNQFMEILKMWFDNFIARIIERNMK